MELVADLEKIVSVSVKMYLRYNFLEYLYLYLYLLFFEIEYLYLYLYLFIFEIKYLYLYLYLFTFVIKYLYLYLYLYLFISDMYLVSSEQILLWTLRKQERPICGRCLYSLRDRNFTILTHTQE